MLSQCGDQSATVRYRVIATADVDGQRVEGSTVMEVSYRRVKNSLIGAGGATKLYGEALILDLKGRGTVFLLPVRHHNKTELMEIYEHGILLTFGVRNSIGTLADEDFARLRQAKGRRPLSFAPLNPPLRLPAFVAFRDEKIPNTIYEVDPQQYGQRFSRRPVHQPRHRDHRRAGDQGAEAEIAVAGGSLWASIEIRPESCGPKKTGRSDTKLRMLISLETGADNA